MLPTSKVVSREQCPRCLDSGKDNLVRYDDGHAYCFSCKYVENGTTPAVQTIAFDKPGVSFPQNILPLDEYKGKPYIRPEILRAYSMYAVGKIQPYTGTVIPADNTTLCYLYCDTENIIGIKYRDLNREKDKGIWWEPGSQSLFFGMQLCRPSSDKILIVCEGESDTLALASQLFQYLGVKFDIIGVSGASSLLQKLQLCMSLVRQYGSVYICMDADRAGKEAEEQASSVMPLPNTYYVHLPGKDICECIEKSLPWYEGFATANLWVDPILITGDDLVRQFNNYLNPVDFIGFNTGYRRINKMLGGGFQRGEILLITGHSGSGKSTLTTNIVYNILALHPDVNLLWIGSEMQCYQSYRALLERHANQPILMNPETEEFNIPRETIMEYARQLSSRVVYNTNILGCFEETEKAIKTAVVTLNIGVVVVDVINDIDPGINQQDTCRNIMKRLNLIAVGDTDNRIPAVAMILVGHTVKNSSGNYSERISREDIRSPGILQLSTASIAVNGDVNASKRYIELVKRSRMGVSQETECWMEYSIPRACYVELETI